MPSSDASTTPRPSFWDRAAPGSLVALICGLHALAVWWALGGWAGINGEWPLLQADHGIHYSHALSSQVMLRETGFTAGYDPSFMAGFPMSVLAGTSFTVANVALAVGHNLPPAMVYKATVGGAVALCPFLIAGAAAILRFRRVGVAWATGLYLVYFWTDFPLSYASLGMIAFLVSVPTSLLALGLLARFLERGGAGRWTSAAWGLALAFFAHLTSPLVLGPAGLGAYLVAIGRSRRGNQTFPISRHLGFWGLAPVILVVNIFWWLPGYWLRGTAGETRLAFAHPESVLGRLGAIFWNEPPVESVLIGLGLLGLALFVAARPVAAAGLVGFVAAGLGWGYLAGWSRALDGLQPGRQTYAMYAGLCLAGGFLLGEVSATVRAARPGRWDRWAALAILLVGTRFLGPTLVGRVRSAVVGPDSFLSSQPQPALLRLVDLIRQHTKPGERLLYEETGLGIPGLADPFGGSHLSPVLPEKTGVEVLGGPYLHTPLATNFTQFGEERLFDDPHWDRDQFTRYARLYRPAAIACWTPKARAFCRNNPDLVRIVADDPVFTVGRVLGFEGFTITGSARVEATPNQLVVRDLQPDPADGRIILRYHWTPYLATDPPTFLEPVTLAADPVPFIALKPTGPTPGPVTIRLALPYSR